MAVKTLRQPATIEEVQARIRSLRLASERKWGEMSSHQMICHVADSFDMVVGGRRVAPIKTALPAPIMKWLALQLPTRWPQGVPTVTEVKQGAGGTPPVEWQQDHRRLIEGFQAFCRKREGWPTHPIFGAMNETDWMRWGYLHCDHHLRQFGV